MKKYMIPIVVKYIEDDWIQTNQTSVIAKEKRITKEFVRNTIEEHLKKIKDNKHTEIVFSGIDTQDKEELIEVAFEYLKAEKVEGIRVITRPNCIDKKFLKMLKKYKVKNIELEIASTNDYILKTTGFKYNSKHIKKATKLIKFYRINLTYQMFLGLTESTKLDDINTAKALAKMKPNSISITPVLVIEGTPLEKKYNKNEYKPLTLVQATEICEEIVKELNKSKIETIAIGYGMLDNDIEQLEIAEKVKDGPFHPSFRQLVESGLWYDAIVSKIKKLNVKVMQVEVTVNPIDVNNVIGYQNQNIKNLKEIYDVDLIITPDENIKQGKSKIEVTQKF